MNQNIVSLVPPPNLLFCLLIITGDTNLGTDVSLHNSHFKMDERQMALGAALHAATALEFINRHGHGNSSKQSADEL